MLKRKGVGDGLEMTFGMFLKTTTTASLPISTIPMTT